VESQSRIAYGRDMRNKNYFLNRTYPDKIGIVQRIRSADKYLSNSEFLYHNSAHLVQFSLSLPAALCADLRYRGFQYAYGVCMSDALKTKINLLKTKRNLLYIRNSSAPRCKHLPPRLKKPFS
jgi:hypothetical protein